MPVFLASIGRFSARHRLVVAAGWLVIFAALTTVLVTAKSDSASTVSIPSNRAAETLQTVQHEFPGLAGSAAADNLQLVLQTTDGTKITAPANHDEVTAFIADTKAVDHVGSVSNPFNAKTPFVSADGTTAVATITFEGLTEDNSEAVQDAVLAVGDQSRGTVNSDVGGAIYTNDVPPAGPGEVVGVLIAFVVLFLTFGSLLVAGANMLVAILGLAVGTIGVLAWGTVHPLEGTTLTLATMLGLAVGIDYSLFIISRFRTELREGRGVQDAVARATGTAGTAVVFAGLTVIIALVALRVVGISFITDMGLAGAFAVLIAVLMSLTMLPVILRTLGLRALGRKRHLAPATANPTEEQPKAGRNVFATWVDFLVRRPLTSIVGAVTVLVIVATPMLSMQTASSVPGGSDPHSSQRHAYTTVVDRFGGIQSPLLILLSGPDAATTVKKVSAGFQGLPQVQAVTPGPVTDSGDAALINVIPKGDPIDEGTKDLVQEIRANTTTIPGVSLEVTGETAIGLDSDADLHQALIKYIIVIVVLSFLLLILMFRSLLVPLAATVGFLLSVGASFGASTAVFQWGWFDKLIPAPQGDPMLSILPIILVGVLFGLAMDYQVFLVSRIHEMHGKGLGPKEAIKQGFLKSAPILVAAATIMTVVFSGFATSPSAVAASIAFGLVAGVVADAFFVRMIIIPALLALMGNAAWWLPRWLDKILPNLDVEGHALDALEKVSSETDRVPALV